MEFKIEDFFIVVRLGLERRVISVLDGKVVGELEENQFFFVAPWLDLVKGVAYPGANPAVVARAINESDFALEIAPNEPRKARHPLIDRYIERVVGWDPISQYADRVVKGRRRFAILLGIAAIQVLGDEKKLATLTETMNLRTARWVLRYDPELRAIAIADERYLRDVLSGVASPGPEDYKFTLDVVSGKVTE